MKGVIRFGDVLTSGLVLAILSAAAVGQEIVATPGTYELVGGASMQFDGRSKENAREIDRYQWEIIAGDGAQLVNADRPRVTFIAPGIKEKSRIFTLQLTSHYQKGKPSRAQLNIRVHRKSKVVGQRSTSPWVGGAIGFGFGYLWGGWWPYPPLIIITPPPPGEILPPEELPPVAVPLPEDPGYDDWVKDHPDVEIPETEGAVLLPETPVESVLPEDQPEIQPVPELPMGPAVELPVDAVPKPEILPVAPPDPMPVDVPEPMPMDMPIDMDIPMDMDFD